MITRGIKLVAGGIIERVWGFWFLLVGVLGGREGSRGGLSDPYRARFAHLEDLYGTRFGSNHHIIVQLVNVCRVGITDPFVVL